MGETIGPLVRLVRLLSRRSRVGLVALIAMALGITAVELVGATALYALLARLTTPGDAPALPGPVAALLPGAEVPDLEVLGVMLVGFFLVRAVLLIGRGYAEGRIVHGIGLRLSLRLLAGYLAMPYLEHTRRSSSELIRNAHEATERLEGQALRPLAVIGAEATLSLGLLALVLATDPLTGLLGAALLGTAVLVVQRLLRPRMRVWGRLAQDARQGSIEGVQQAVGGIRDLKVLGRERTVLDRHAAHRRRMARSGYLFGAATQLPRALIELALVVTVVGALLVAVRVQGTAADLSTLGLFAYAGVRLQPSLQMLVTAVNQLRFGSAAVRDVVADLEALDAAGTRLPHGRTEATPAAPPEVRLERVAFRYAADGPWVLEDVDLAIAPGEFVGICGATGCGKSTLLDVLVGLLPPTRGLVRADGRPLDPEPRWWWSRIGVVSQAPYLLDDTLRANVALGVPRAEVDADRLARSIAAAQLTEVVAQLPDGLDTVVGERGIRLSGGQRQRVALARALYRDPPVLVLDEGTSALDAATEAAVMSAVGGGRGGRTVVAVAHRLSTLRAADRIVVMEAGRVVDVGTWEDLEVRSPVFRTLAGAAA